MKKLLILFFMCLAMEVRATTVLLWGWNNQWSTQPESIVQNTSTGESMSVNDIPLDKVNTIRISEWANDQFVRFLDIYVDGCGLEDGECGIEALPDDEFHLTAWTQSLLGDDYDSSHTLKMEMLFIEWDEEYNPISFQPYAEASATIGSIQKYVYEQADISPDDSIPWWPEVFYTDYPVPEPSISILIMFGICALLLKRKNYERA